MARPMLRLLSWGMSFGVGCVNLGDVATGKLHNGGLAAPRGVRSDEHQDAICFRLIERVRKTGDFIPHQFAAVRIRRMPVGYDYLHLAKLGFYSPRAIGIVRAPDLYARRVAVI